MKTVYHSSSSISVKIVTVGIILIFILMIWELIFRYRNYVVSYVIISIIFVLLLYFYLNSLKEVVVDGKKIILKKIMGKIELDIEKIIDIKRLEFSNLDMTVGSKGYFGFIGSTMENSYSYVKDRNKMVKIILSGKSYIISVDTPEDLILKFINK